MIKKFHGSSIDYNFLYVGDQTVRVWDVRNSHTPQTVIPAHASEILTCDWSKYDQVC